MDENKELLTLIYQDADMGISSLTTLIRKLNNEEAYAFSVPLLVDSTGRKLGKSFGNALWIDEEKTSSYEMYQYILNFEDIMMEEYLVILVKLIIIMVPMSN